MRDWIAAVILAYAGVLAVPLWYPFFREWLDRARDHRSQSTPVYWQDDE